MDERADEIINDIETERDRLGRNLNELETRVRRVTDWRAQFDNNPMLMIGAALGGGVLLGAIVAGSRRHNGINTAWSSSPRNYAASSVASSDAAPDSPSSTPSYGYGSNAISEQRRKANDVLETIKAALIGFGTAKVKEFMSEALPGFNQHLEEAQRRFASRDAGTESSYGGGASNSGTQRTGETRTEYSSHSPYSRA